MASRHACSRRIAASRVKHQRMAFPQHVVDLVKGPLAVAGRTARPHRIEARRAVEAEIALRFPMSEAAGLAVEIVQRALQRYQAAAEARGVDRIAGRGRRSCRRLRPAQIDRHRPVAGKGADTRDRPGIAPALEIEALEGIEEREGGDRRCGFRGSAFGVCRGTARRADDDPAGGAGLRARPGGLAVCRRCRSANSTTRSRAAMITRRRKAASAGRRMRMTWLRRWRGKTAAMSPSASPAKAHSVATMRRSASRLRSIALSQFTTRLLLHVSGREKGKGVFRAVDKSETDPDPRLPAFSRPSWLPARALPSLPASRRPCRARSPGAAFRYGGSACRISGWRLRAPPPARCRDGGRD